MPGLFGSLLGSGILPPGMGSDLRGNGCQRHIPDKPLPPHRDPCQGPDSHWATPMIFLGFLFPSEARSQDLGPDYCANVAAPCFMMVKALYDGSDGIVRRHDP
jgi:hypothetical protein